MQGSYLPRSSGSRGQIRPPQTDELAAPSPRRHVAHLDTRPNSYPVYPVNSLRTGCRAGKISFSKERSKNCAYAQVVLIPSFKMQMTPINSGLSEFILKKTLFLGFPGFEQCLARSGTSDVKVVEMNGLGCQTREPSTKGRRNH
ncbi:MAG: hypothetical protein U0794_19415 [Isosphaeraceae bacterium]